MRHRIGFVLAVAMLATLFFAGGWGYLRLLRLPASGETLTGLPAGGGHLFSDTRMVLGLLAVAGTGLLAGLLIAVPRVSPLAAGLPGLVLLSWTGFYLVNVRQAVDLIPLRSDAYGSGFEAMLFNGSLGAAGLAMIVPMLIPSRWRRATSADIEPAGFFDTEPRETVPTLSGVVTFPPGPVPSGVPAPAGSAEPAGVPVTRLERVVPARSDTGQAPWGTGPRPASPSGGPGF